MLCAKCSLTETTNSYLRRELHQEDLLGLWSLFWASRCYDVNYWRCFVYNVFVRLYFNGNVNIFFHKLIKKQAENYVCSSLLIICTMNMEFPKSVLWSIMRKLTPCCRNDNIFSLTLFVSILADIFLFVYYLRGKKELNFWTETSLLRAAI